MCGLVGCASPWMNEKEKGIFKQMLYADVFRGIDSTGIARVNKKTGYYGKEDEFNYSIYKKALPSAALLSLKDFKNWENEWNDQPNKGSTKIMMGHNRAATIGNINDKNAHPFQEGEIILSHNGTLWDMTNLEDQEYFDIDSQCIAHNVDVIGIEETVKRLRGAFVLTWIDLRKKTLNFTRNSERPLSIVTCKDGSIYWASEDKMLEWILDRNRIKYDSSWILKPGQHFEFDYTTTGSQFSNFNVYEYELNKEKRVYSGTRTYFSRGDEYDDKGDYAYSSTDKSDKREKREGTLEKEMKKALRSKKNDKIRAKWKQTEDIDDEKSLTDREYLFRKKLRRVGINPDKRVRVQSYDFEEYKRKNKYPDQQLGVILGFIMGDPWMCVEVHGCHRSTYERTKKVETFFTMPTTIRNDGATDLVVCHGVAFLNGVETSREILCLPGVKEEGGKKDNKKDKCEKGNKDKRGDEKSLIVDKDGVPYPREDDREMQYTSPYGIIISEREMEKLVSKGCESCSRDIDKDEYNVVHWLENGLCICGRCKDELSMIHPEIQYTRAAQLVKNILH